MKARKAPVLVLLCVAVGVTFASLHRETAATQSGIPATKVEYGITQTNSSNNSSTLMETSTYLITTDGRVRLERQKPGSPPMNVEITNFLAKTKYILNVANKTAKPNPMQLAPARQPSPYSVGNTRVMDDGSINLGTKVVGGLTLKGSRQEMRITPVGKDPRIVTHETWVYQLGVSPLAILVLEHHQEMAGWIVDQHITRVSQVSVDSGVFEVPPDFTILTGGN